MSRKSGNRFSEKDMRPRKNQGHNPDCALARLRGEENAGATFKRDRPSGIETLSRAPHSGRLAFAALACKPIQRRAQKRQRIVEGQSRFCLAADRPARPCEERLACFTGGRKILPRAAPAQAGLQARRRRPRRSGQIGIDQRRNIDAGERAGMMPEREARVDFQKPEIALHVAL